MSRSDFAKLHKITLSSVRKWTEWKKVNFILFNFTWQSFPLIDQRATPQREIGDNRFVWEGETGAAFSLALTKKKSSTPEEAGRSRKFPRCPSDRAQRNCDVDQLSRRPTRLTFLFFLSARASSASITSSSSHPRIISRKLAANCRLYPTYISHRGKLRVEQKRSSYGPWRFLTGWFKFYGVGISFWHVLSLIPRTKVTLVELRDWKRKAHQITDPVER